MVVFTALAGRVGRRSLLALASCLGLTLAARAQTPANDDPCGAVTLTPQGSLCLVPTVSTNAGATTTVPNGYFNPGQNTMVNGCGTALNPKDVWFKFTTTATGLASFGATITVSGNPAGLLRLFSAPSCTGPFASILCSGGTTNNSVAARLATGALAANTTYYVQVAGYGSTDVQGPFTICLTDGPGTPACLPVNTIRESYPAGLRLGQGVVSFVPGANNVPPYTLTITGGGVPTRVFTTNASPVTVDGLIPGGFQSLTITSACSFGGSASQGYAFNYGGANGRVCNALPLGVNPTCQNSGGGLYYAGASGSIGCGNSISTFYACQWYSFTTAATGPGSTQATVTTASSQGANEVQVWSGNPCPGNNYQSLTQLACTTGSSQFNSAPAITLTTLSPATTYYVQVGSGRQGWTGGGSFTICVTAPGGCVPPAVQMSSVSNTSAVLQITPLVNATPPTGYTITYQPAGGPIQTLTTPTPTVALSSLLPNTTYTVSVAATCASGGTAAPAILTFTTTGAAAACAVPTALAATNVVSGGTASLSFGAAAGATGYVVSYQAPGASPQVINTASSPVTLTGLLPGTTYAVLVQAVCPAGTSDPQVLNLTTPALTVSNDDCATALALPVSPVCRFTQATSLGATASTGVPAPGCGSTFGGINDVWFALEVPANGVVQVTTAPVTGSIVTDTGLALYGGTCGTLGLLGCNDDYAGGGRFSQLRLTGQAPGATLYARVWRSGGNGVGGPFNLCATTDATLATASAVFGESVLLYPNPAHTAFTVQVPADLRPTGAARLYNALGQELRQLLLTPTPAGAEARVEVAGLPAGVYALRLPTATGVVTKRVVVE